MCRKTEFTYDANVNCGISYSGWQHLLMLVGCHFRLYISISGVAVTAITCCTMAITTGCHHCCCCNSLTASWCCLCCSCWCCHCAVANPALLADAVTISLMSGWLLLFGHFAIVGAVAIPFAEPTCQSCVALPLSCHSPNGIAMQVDCNCPNSINIVGEGINLWQQYWHCASLHHASSIQL